MLARVELSHPREIALSGICMAPAENGFDVEAKTTLLPRDMLESF